MSNATGCALSRPPATWPSGSATQELLEARGQLAKLLRRLGGIRGTGPEGRPHGVAAGLQGLLARCALLPGTLGRVAALALLALLRLALAAWPSHAGHPGHAGHAQAAPHLLHHLLGLGEPLEQLVDVLHRPAGATGDPRPARPVDDLRVLALVGR